MGRNDGRKRKQIPVRSSFPSLSGFPYNQSCDIVSQISAWTTDVTHDLRSGVGGGSSFLEKLIINVAFSTVRARELLSTVINTKIEEDYVVSGYMLYQLPDVINTTSQKCSSSCYGFLT